MPIQPWVGELMLAAEGFAPKGWAVCDGRLLSVTGYPQLFALIGNTFGGDGVNKFALPDLGGRVAVGAGQGPGLENYTLGQTGGAETVTLSASQLPSHTHNVACNSQGASAAAPDGTFPGTPAAPLYAAQSDGTLFSVNMLTASGNQTPVPHENMQPYTVLQWVIATTGDSPFGDS